MARTEGDSWDAASSVGVTATIVATARAVASRATPPLIDDPFAAPLVRAVGIDILTALAEGTLDPTALDVPGGDAGDEDSGGHMGLAGLADMMAVRTRFFDDFFLAAGDGGIRQVVILAAGLDARAHRLGWAADTAVFEIDQPAVVDFTTRVYADLGALPTARRHTVAVDLRDDWPAALRAAGFDDTRPTAWSAEGLLAYLPPEAQDRLLETVTALSAPGSRFGVEAVSSVGTADRDEVIAHSQRLGRAWRDAGLDLQFADLLFFGERRAPAEHLAAIGWEVDAVGLDELLRSHDLPSFGDAAEGPGFGAVSYLTATLR